MQTDVLSVTRYKIKAMPYIVHEQKAWFNTNFFFIKDPLIIDDTSRGVTETAAS